MPILSSPFSYSIPDVFKAELPSGVFPSIDSPVPSDPPRVVLLYVSPAPVVWEYELPSPPVPAVPIIVFPLPPAITSDAPPALLPPDSPEYPAVCTASFVMVSPTPLAASLPAAEAISAPACAAVATPPVAAPAATVPAVFAVLPAILEARIASAATLNPRPGIGAPNS